jgi:nucleoside-diphosphate-sugar epimerase
MKKAVVCGAGGFIGGHLVRRLKSDGYWVRGVDLKQPEWSASAADEFLVEDLRDREACRRVLSVTGDVDEVFQLAADMGGMGFISSAACEILHNNALINLNMVDAAVSAGVPRYFLSSSVCVYRDMAPGEPALNEDEAYPAMPDNDYGWEKLYAERVALAHGHRHDMTVRIARFQNCYGAEGVWRDGREKAPAAICRKVAEAGPGGTIEVWGDGSAVRSYTYVDDVVDGVVRLMASPLEGPVNIGSPEYVTVEQLVGAVAKVAGKDVEIEYVPGPVGVRSRNFSLARIETTGWRSEFGLEEGLSLTYPWIERQVRRSLAT